MAFFPSNAKPARMSAAEQADEEYGATAQPDWREVNWREHMHEVQVHGRRVNYVDYGSGEGPPVILIHGLGGCWQNWLENIRAAGEVRRVLALDLPGFGHSEMPSDDISISGYGKTVEEFCDQLGLGKVVLVGNSMGGFIAAEMAIQFSERVDRMVLAAAAGISITSLYRRPTLTIMRVAAAVSSRVAASSESIVKRPRMRHAAMQTIVRHPTRLKPELLYELMSGAGRPAFMPALEALLDYDFRDRLPEIRCPALIVHGEDDMLVPVKDGREFERAIKDSRAFILEDTGHMPMVERPETFNKCLLEFLSESADAPASERGEAAAA